jgi:hypothetical protein
VSGWKVIIAVPQVFDIDFARDVETAQRGAESVRSRFRNVDAAGQLFYPMILAVTGPPEVIEEYRQRVEPKELEPVQLRLPLDEPDDHPPAA